MKRGMMGCLGTLQKLKQDIEKLITDTLRMDDGGNGGTGGGYGNGMPIGGTGRAGIIARFRGRMKSAQHGRRVLRLRGYSEKNGGAYPPTVHPTAVLIDTTE